MEDGEMMNECWKRRGVEDGEKLNEFVKENKEGKSSCRKVRERESSC